MTQSVSATTSEKNPKVGFVSLGCPKALVDSERILTQLRLEGYEVSATYKGADVVVVNTCGFIDSAKQESLDAIGEAIKKNGRVIVTGCMGKDAEQITSVHPKVLAVTGPQQYEDVVNAVHKFVPPKQNHDPFIDLVPPQGIKLTPRHYAYLKISEGCNHRCTFCIIPSMRGDLVSRPAGSVLEEAERLVKAGVKELLVISQDTSAYGVDLKYKTDFWNGRPVKSKMYDLCDALGDMGVWVRLHYVYPYPHVDDIMPLMAQGKILPYLDIPFQHASPRILQLMKRPGSAEKTIERIKRWRDQVPALTVRSTFIVGFPGETEAEFAELLDFLEEAEIDRAGAFIYSPVEGAKSNDLPDHVDPDIQQERLQAFMETQARISARKLERKIGHTITVLVDEVDDEGAVCRSAADAPEIDGNVFVEGSAGLKPGDFIDVKIVDSDEHDLWGERSA